MEEYGEVFSIQWKNFCNEFLLDARKRRDKGLEADKMNEWYSLNIKRWDNVAEREGTLLLEQDNEEMIKSFLDKLYSFKFEDESSKKSNVYLIRGVIILLIAAFIPIYASLHIELPFTFIEVEYWKTVAVALVIAFFAIYKTFVDIKNANEKDDERRREAYKMQLQRFGEEMLNSFKEMGNSERIG